MAILDRAALLTPSDLKCETVKIGPLGGEVVMQELSVVERLRVLKEFRALDTEDEVAATRGLIALVVASLRNEDHSVMFPPEEREEAVDGLMARSSAAVEQLVTECQRIQGMGQGALKEAVKNSEATRSDSSPSGSPETSATPTSVS